MKQTSGIRAAVFDLDGTLIDSMEIWREVDEDFFARRGMAVWIISSGIDAICEKTDNEEFLRRLRYIKE